mmetsp:Transcript_16491/g.41140  ORF Transcript_16491/g.41140 Transcript_16491/m.41140 type:complete len:345 (-) Transcript_16491:94-1128(-)
MITLALAVSYLFLIFILLPLSLAALSRCLSSRLPSVRRWEGAQLHRGEGHLHSVGGANGGPEASPAQPGVVLAAHGGAAHRPQLKLERLLVAPDVAVAASHIAVIGVIRRVGNGEENSLGARPCHRLGLEPAGGCHGLHEADLAAPRAKDERLVEAAGRVELGRLEREQVAAVAPLKLARLGVVGREALLGQRLKHPGVLVGGHALAGAVRAGGQVEHRVPHGLRVPVKVHVKVVHVVHARQRVAALVVVDAHLGERVGLLLVRHGQDDLKAVQVEVDGRGDGHLLAGHFFDVVKQRLAHLDTHSLGRPSPGPHLLGLHVRAHPRAPHPNDGVIVLLLAVPELG